MKKVKLHMMTEKEKENSLNEVRILASINDDFIVGYKEAFFEDETMTLCLVMEYAAGGDLQEKMNIHVKNQTFI
jgi:NIMA (never in mitosis gene a)-related kinase